MQIFLVLCKDLLFNKKRFSALDLYDVPKIGIRFLFLFKAPHIKAEVFTLRYMAKCSVSSCSWYIMSCVLFSIVLAI